MTITVDFSGADKKMQALFRMEGATKKALTGAMAQTILRAKHNVSGGILRARTSHLFRNIGGEVKEPTKGLFQVGIGTGNLIGKTEVKYARIQEFGGPTHPTVTAKMRRWAWAMFYGGFKTEIKGLGLRGSERTGARMTYGGMGNIYKAIALTKKSTLNIKIPPSHWLSRSIQESEGYFMQALSPKNLLREMDYPERED